MKPPSLKAFVDGEAVCQLDPPAVIEPRHWVLGVIAVQLTVAAGRVRSVLRGHVTGWPEPIVVPLSGSAVVHVTLGDTLGARDDQTPPFPQSLLSSSVPSLLPSIAPRPLLSAEARLALFLDGAPLAESQLDPATLGFSPPPRAFGHVFCRWIRDGGFEPGCDLTAFQSTPPGVKFQRLINRPLNVGEIVSYAVDLRVRGLTST